jgi:sugar phosphate isomerase/epimerase
MLSCYQLTPASTIAWFIYRGRLRHSKVSDNSGANLTTSSDTRDVTGNPIADTERPLSLSYYTVPELDALETVAVAAVAGCLHVGLRLLGGQPGSGETALLNDPALRRKMREAMSAHSVSALDANTVRLVPTTDIAAYSPFFDAASELGARHVLTTVDDPEPDRLADNLMRLCEMSAERALTIDFEFVPWLHLSNIEATAGLIRQCKHSALGISVDALHFFRSHGSPEQIAQMPREWFRYAQLCDVASAAPPPSRQAFIDEATQERLRPGEGVIDLVGLLRALPPGIPLALEIPQVSLSHSQPARIRVRQAVAATRRILRAAAVD